MISIMGMIIIEGRSNWRRLRNCMVTAPLSQPSFPAPKAQFHIGNDAVQALREIGVDGQGQDGHAEAESRGDEGFADAAGNGDGLAGLDVEDTEGANHAADCPQKPQERRHGDDDRQIIEAVAQFRNEDARLHLDEGLDVRPSLALEDLLQR